MIEEFFSNPAVLKRLHVGPLGSYVDAFASLLSEQGYARSTTKTKVSLIADYSQWLHRQQLRVDELDDQRIIKFLKYRRKRGRVHPGNIATLQSLLEQLRESGNIPALVPEIDDSSLHLIERNFEQYLTQERGLSLATVINYLPFAQRFLSERFGTDAILLDELRSTDVTGFILRYAHTASPGRAKLMVTALRVFFRFLHQRGDISTNLAECIPPVADWRLSQLPKSLEKEQVERLLKGCDRGTTTGQRDYTILLLLARLGLRAGEVVAMSLDDIDWEAGELTIRGKGRRQDQLPIPQDVGEALAKYLRHGRPHCSTRRVFIRMNAPLRGFSSSVAICTIVRRALERAGLQPARKGAHLLRHSLATQMLRKGASLAEIGEILRHRLPNTTEIYAKVDLNALRALAQPWPGGEA